MEKALKPPPPQKKGDISDELSKLFDDGTVLESEKKRAATPSSGQSEAYDTSRLTSPRLGSPRLTSAQPNINTFHNSAKSTNQPGKAPVAASRDFNRRPNSLERDALPAGLFPGTSKKVYDALFLRTRGAHQPTRTIQATRSELMKWAGIGSRNTFLSHMRYLTRVGLVIRRFEVGNNDGAEYEVCIPEELGIDSSQPSPQLTSAHLGSSQPDSAQNLVVGSAQKLSRAEVGKPTEKIDASGPSNTSFKTDIRNDDEADEAFAGLIKIFRETVHRITGQAPTIAECDRWAELGEVLAAELNKAAARTETISSLPAFFTEHLRRRFNQAERKGKSVPGEKLSARAPISANIGTEPAPISAEEKKEFRQMIVDLVLSGGYTIDQAQSQFGSTLPDDEWHLVTSELKEKTVARNAEGPKPD